MTTDIAGKKDAHAVRLDAEAINGIITARLADRTVNQAPHRIILECDIILRGSTRRQFTPENLTRPQTP